MTIIGVTGYARHGKDTVGRVLVEEFGYTRFAFADILKSMALTLNPIVLVDDEDQAEFEAKGAELDPPARIPTGFHRLADIVAEYGWELAKEIKEVRRFLQVLGTEAVRDHLGDDTWVNAVDIAIAKAGVTDVVMTDARFPNEFAWCRDRGQLWKVMRLNPDGTEFDNGLSKDHPSEKHIAGAPASRQIATADIEELRQWARAGAADLLPATF